MSAAPTSLSLALAEKRHWVTAAQLAAATGKSVRTIQWACQHAGLAHCHRFEKNPDGGRDLLKIDLAHAPEEYRLAYAQGQKAEAGAAILKLTDKQRQKAAEAATLIQLVDAYIASLPPGSNQNEAIEAFLASRRVTHPNTPSLRTYYRAKEKWLAGGKTLAALADQRAVPGKGVKAEFDEDAFAFFSSIYLRQGGPNAAVCYRQLVAKAHEEGWSIPSLPTVKRTLDARVPKAKQDELRKGPEFRRNKHDPYIPRNWDSLAINECWVSDHCELDIVGIDDLPGGDGKPARMWLTTWMDERSRYIVGWRVHRGPNSREVLASFYYSVLDHGLPQNIRIDNGKDYRCHRFAGGKNWRVMVERLKVDEREVRPVLMELGITPHFAREYNAKAKIVEPWHKHFVKEQFSRLMPGFCGGSPDEKPEELPVLIKERRILHWSMLVEHLATAIQGYNLKSHESLGGQCPAMVRHSLPFTKRTADQRTLAMLFQDCRKKTIGRMGIQIDGFTYGIGNPDIISRQGELVHARMDLFGCVGTIWVYEPNGRFICTAENAGLCDANATQEDVKEWQKFTARSRRMADELATMMPILQAVDPAEQVRLLKRHGEIQLEKAGIVVPQPEPSSYKPLEFHGGGVASTALPVAPGNAPSTPLRLADGNDSKGIETKERTDSPTSGGAGLSKDDILSLYDAG